MSETKEIINTTPESVSLKTREIVDQKPEAMVPRELKTLLQKIEESPVPQPTFDPNGQPQLTPVAPTSPKITLPVTRTTFVAGFKKKLNDVGHWLSKFLFREIKLKEGNVTFKPDDS